MSTGTIQQPSKTIFKYQETNGNYISFTADSDLVQGLSVKISGDGTVDKVTLGSEIPVGVVTVGGLSGERVSVLVGYMADSLGVATGGALVAGALVVANGVVDANGVPQYVLAIAGENANGIVLVGAAQDEEIRIGILKTPIVQV